MTTWQTNLDRRDRSFLVFATIQGLGDGNGLWRFSSSEGWTLESGEGTWKPYLNELPDILSEKVPFFTGGVVESSSGVELKVLDYKEEVSSLIGPDYGVATFISQDLSRTGLVMNIDLLPDEMVSGEVGNGDILWIGSEAVKIVSSTPNTITIERAQLGTFAIDHIRGTEVFIYPRLIISREMRVYIAPIEGSEIDKRLVGVYTVDAFGLSDSHASWEFQGIGRDQFLARKTPRQPYVYTVNTSIPSSEDNPLFFIYLVQEEDRQPEITLGQNNWATYMVPGEKEIWRLQQGRGIAFSSNEEGSRGHALSPREEQPSIGTKMRRVLSVANGDFRATGISNSTSDRTSSSFEKVTSWVEVLLCILLSPAIEGQGATNYNTSGTGWDGRNFSGLPPYYGAGINWEEIDFDSFAKVAASEVNYNASFFIFGTEVLSLAEAINPLLKVAGAFLVREKSRIRLVVPELPLIDDTSTYNIDASTILMRNSSQPAINTQYRKEEASELVFKLGPQEVVRPISITDIARLYNPQDLYIIDTNSIDIDASFMDPNTDEYLYLGTRQLIRLFTNYIELDLDLEGSFFESALGGNSLVSISGIPNFRGGRGLSGIGQLTELEVVAEKSTSLKCRVKVLVQPSVRLGKIGPAADIVSVDGFSCTVSSNVYTAVDSDLLALPTNDALAFTEGDFVKLVSPSGVPSSDFQQITSVSSDLIELDGDFSNSLSPGSTIIYANYSDSSENQTDRYVYFDRNWRFG